jgi:hypothetical protein
MIKLAGLDCQVPDFSTVSQRQKHLLVTPGAQTNTTRDRTSRSTAQGSSCCVSASRRPKNGAGYRTSGVRSTLASRSNAEIRTIEVTDNATGNALIPPHLLDAILADEAVASVSGDGAYDTKAVTKRSRSLGHRRLSRFAERQAMEGPAS